MIKVAFGQGDSFALPRLSPWGFGAEVIYTHPTYNSCYSVHGFACPLDDEGIPFSVFLEKKHPVQVDVLRQLATSYTYLLIDHGGNVWKAYVHFSDEQNEWVLSYVAVVRNSTSWWITAKDRQDLFKTELRVLLGFLSTNPKVGQIEQFWTENNSGADLEWFSVREIVQTLNSRFPLTKSEPVDDSKTDFSKIQKIIGALDDHPDLKERLWAILRDIQIKKGKRIINLMDEINLFGI